VCLMSSKRVCQLLASFLVGCAVVTLLKHESIESPAIIERHIPGLVESAAHECATLYASANAGWEKRACKTTKAFDQADLDSPPGITSFDMWEPTYFCEAEDRVGRPYYGDGPKFVCGAEFLRNKRNCLVYSIGR
jgi:Methyltransferase domain